MLAQIFLPAILTILGNIFFYIIIKQKVDKSIEEYKITFSGIFKEKITIYQNLLEKSYSLKFKIENYYKCGNLTEVESILSEIHSFIMYYLKNQPFLSFNMIKALDGIQKDFQFIFKNSYEFHSVSRVSGIEPSIVKEIEEKFNEVSTRMKDDKVMNQLQEIIIMEMRKDLKT